jgi:hypothetical protein
MSHDRKRPAVRLAVCIWLGTLTFQACTYGTPSPPTRGGTITMSVRQVLPAGRAEEAGYGLYSYLLLASPPATDIQRARYLSAVRAYLDLAEIGEIEGRRLASREELNITYFPVRRVPPDSSAATFLAHHDHARAQLLLARVPGLDRSRPGPFLISGRIPLTRPAGPPGRILVQDLSSVPAHLVHLWVRQFLAQAEDERVWAGEVGQESFALRLRTLVAQGAEGLPDVRNGITGWIQWVGATGIR